MRGVLSFKHGDKIGMLTILNKVGSDCRGSIWECMCDCGKSTIKHADVIKRVLHFSCGCNSKFNRNPNRKHIQLLKVWCSMRSRCLDVENLNYHNYGGRGIKVCERWMDYDNFFSDVIDGYEPGLQLDRENNNGNYEPSNCRWTTQKINSRNRRTTKLSQEKADFIRASELSNWDLAKMFNVHYETIRHTRKGRLWAA